MNRTIWPSRVGDLLEHRLQALLELAAVLGAGHQGAQVQGHHPLVVQALGHVAAHDALGQAFDDGRLADAGLADQHRVVLGAPGEHLDDAADLLVAADHRVELALAGGIGQVAAVLLQGLVGGFGVLAGHALAASDAGERLHDGRAVHPMLGQDLGGVAGGCLLHDGQQQVLGRDVLVVQPLGNGMSTGQDVAGLVREAQLRSLAGDAGEVGQAFTQRLGNGCRVLAGLLQHGRHHAIRLVDQGQQQVGRGQLGMALALGQLLRGQDRLLGPRGEAFGAHRSTSFARRSRARPGWIGKRLIRSQ